MTSKGEGRLARFSLAFELPTCLVGVSYPGFFPLNHFAIIPSLDNESIQTHFAASDGNLAHINNATVFDTSRLWALMHDFFLRQQTPLKEQAGSHQTGAMIDEVNVLGTQACSAVAACRATAVFLPWPCNFAALAI